ncbi:MAG TPA: FAD-dependent oxidoreductase [Caulobacteraceae bacterium]|nr:FAD-dependent oxidoreductase [Caulobacteraceae bacterium]
MAPRRATKVAIIGGGCAAITTAFELTRPEMAGRYDVTVYQMGWRLGGKGASGRGASGRIEEHGLHIWLGCYDNAFRLMRECYAELATDPAAREAFDWPTAFTGENAMGVSAPSGADGWHNWSATFPPRPGLPGDPLAPGELLSLPRYIGRAIDLLRTLILSVDSRQRGGGETRPGPSPFSAATARGDPQRMAAAIADLVGGAFAASGAVIAEALALLQAGLETLPSPLSNPLTDLAVWIAHQLRRWLETGVIATPHVQHVWEMMDIVVASLVGILRFDLLTDPRGFDAIDDYDWREWLIASGASERAARSAFVRGIYDLLFGYEDGDPTRPRLAAGVGLRGTLRMFFGYRGALYWRMRAGMGDVVFAPYYEVLRRRGVKFAFFHRLTNVRLAEEADLRPGERPYVSALEFDIQATVKDGADYAPLVEVRGRPCWPAAPDFRQLEDGEEMAREGRDFESHWDNRRAATRTLQVAKDFDFVVLGVGLGAVPHVCREIIARNPRWNRMVREVKTNAIQAFQVWLDHDLQDLGWTGEHLIGSGFRMGFEGWADMAHTIPEEGWTQSPKTVLYFCGPLPDPLPPVDDEDADYPRRRNDEVFQNAVMRLRETARHLWPKAMDARGDFRWDMLRDPADPEDTPSTKTGEARFSSQYWRANVNPTDRYVLSTPGSTKYRVSPLDMTYDNLTIAGDWTETGLNVGCVESAVMSGLLAAHALSGAPLLEDIVGYDHP